MEMQGLGRQETHGCGQLLESLDTHLLGSGGHRGMGRGEMRSKCCGL